MFALALGEGMHIRRELFEMFFMNRIPRSGFTLEESGAEGTEAPQAGQSRIPGTYWVDAGTRQAPASGNDALQSPLDGGPRHDQF